MKRINNIFKHLLLLIPVMLLAGCGLNNPETVLKKAAKEVNKTCPQRVDDITTLTKVIYENHCFTYVYELDQDENSEIMMTADEDLLKSAISDMIKANAATDSDVKSFMNELRKDNAKLVHRYVMKDGRSREFEIDY